LVPGQVSLEVGPEPIAEFGALVTLLKGEKFKRNRLVRLAKGTVDGRKTIESHVRGTAFALQPLDSPNGGSGRADSERPFIQLIAKRGHACILPLRRYTANL